MKESWIAILAFSASFAAFAQGEVNFNTHVGWYSPDYHPIVDARVLNPDGTGCTDGFGQLFILNSDESLAPLLPIGAFKKAEAGAGYILAGGAFAPDGFPGGTTVAMILRAWRGEPESTYDSAIWKGQSEPFTITFATLPNPPGDLIGLKGFTLVPEPPALALGAVGFGAMLLLRRRR